MNRDALDWKEGILSRGEANGAISEMPELLGRTWRAVGPHIQQPGGGHRGHRVKEVILTLKRGNFASPGPPASLPWRPCILAVTVL